MKRGISFLFIWGLASLVMCNVSATNEGELHKIRQYEMPIQSPQPALLISSSVNITASLSPALVDPVERLNHAEGTNATFTCSIGSGDLNGLTFEWFKGDRRLSSTNKFKIAVLPDNVNSILRVIDLKPEDSASYSCVAKNRFGQARISTKLAVKGMDIVS